MSNRSGKPCLRSDAGTSDDVITVISKQQSVFLASLDERIVALTNIFHETVKSLRDELSEEKNKVAALEIKMDELEQYSRRNNLRIFGVKEEDREDTDKLLITLFENKLKIQVDVKDIDRCHRVGPKRAENSRPILVKFTSYRTRSQLFKCKKLLKKTGFVIKEDLTKKRHEILKAAGEKYGKHNVWSSDGVIMIAKEGGDKVAITKFSDV